MKIVQSIRWSSVMAAGLAVVALPLLAQVGLVRGFKTLEYYEPGAGGKNATNQFKALLSAAQARPRPDGTAAVEDVRIETYHPDGETNLIATAPTCEVDTRLRVAHSAGRLEVKSADGRFYIEGEGFFCRLTNASLFISNRVRTVLRKDAVPMDSPPAKASLPQAK